MRLYIVHVVGKLKVLYVELKTLYDKEFCGIYFILINVLDS